MRCVECFFENPSGVRRCRICRATLSNDTAPASSETLVIDTTHRRGGFFSFGTLITPAAIQITYIIGAVVITLAGVLMVTLVLTGVASEYTDTNRDALLVGGFTLLGIGNLLWRVLCEMVMLFFRMLEVLLELDDKARSLIGLLAERKRKDTTAPAMGQGTSSVGGSS
jgi:uncharacterized protein DUF4282